MRIMVFDVPAESGGALSVLNDFYREYKHDKTNEYIFVVSKPRLKGTKNIKVLRYPWIKKSWLHRICFDNLIAPKLIKKYKVDEILSLQNTIIPNTKIKQTVYIHNALPFLDYRFKFFENKLLWIYQNIIGIIIFKSIEKANKVIVQTQWMKKACEVRAKVNSDKIEVLPYKVDIKVEKYFEICNESIVTFFYPASGVEFKNHKVIVEACSKLKNRGINMYRIIFTLKGNENKNISNLYEKVKKQQLPIEFIGSISRDVVFEYYSKYILIFPSYIETIGLPLVEAKSHKTPILVSDCEFSHEVLKGYNKVMYFNSFNSNELAEKMYKIMQG